MEIAKVNANTVPVPSPRDRLSQRRTVVLGAGSVLAIAFAAGWTNRVAAASCAELPGAAELHPAPSAGRAAAEPLPVRRQGGAGGQHRQRLRLHAAVRGPAETARALCIARAGDRGLPVGGLPPGTEGQQGIAEQCFDVYGVRFPMFAKSGVVGQTANPFFAALARETGEAPKWNFHKYLVDRQGRAVASFPSAVDPLDRRAHRPHRALVGKPVEPRG